MCWLSDEQSNKLDHQFKVQNPYIWEAETNMFGIFA